MRIRALALSLALVALVSACSDDKKASKPTPEVLAKSALAEQTAGHDDAALGLWRKVLEQAPQSVEAHYNMGVIYQKRGQNDAALVEYGAAIALNPKFVPAMFNSATIYGNADPALAIITYRKVIALQPKAPTAYLNLGLLELGLKQEKQGLKDLTTALHQDPTLIDRLTPAVKEKVSEANQPSPSPST